MTRRIRVEPDAEAELQAAAEWYEQLVVPLGAAHFADFSRAMS